MFMLILMAFIIVASFVFVIVQDLSSTPAPGWVGIVVPQLVFLGVPSAVYLIMHRTKIREILPMRRLGGKNILMVIGMSLALYPLIILINFVTTLFFGNPIADTMEAVQYEGGILLMLILFPILPSIFEEVAMRGIVFSGFAKVKIFSAALINGLFFGVLHQNFNQFSYAFVIGFVMCYMMYYTKSIWAPVLCHFVLNFVLVLVPYLMSRFINLEALEETANATDLQLYQWQEYLISFFVLIFVAALFMAGFIAIYLAYKRHNLRRNEAEGIVTDTYAAAREAGKSKQTAFTWGFWAAMGLSLAWMIYIQWIISQAG